MNEGQYLAYKGQIFQIEFYFDKKGKSQPVEHMLESFTGADAKKFAHLLKLMGDVGQIRNEQKFRNEGDGIYAFKPQPHRFLCFFFEGHKIIITNAFKKKQQKLPKSEKDRALKCKKDFEDRNRKGIYYGQEK